MSEQNYPSYLIHYGIPGQKWGVRRYQNDDGTYTPEGLERRRQGERDFDNTIKMLYGRKSKGVTIGETSLNDLDHSKSVIQKGRIAFDAIHLATPISANPVAAAVDVALKIHAGIDLGKGIKGTIERKNAIKLNEKNENIDEKTGLKLKTNPNMSYKDDLEKVNPGYNNFNLNTKNNCVLCSMAYEMRRRGYDAISREASEGYTDDVWEKIFNKAKVERTNVASLKHQNAVDTLQNIIQNKTENDLKNRKDFSKAVAALNRDKAYKREKADSTLDLMSKQQNSRGTILVAWGNGSGHSMAYEVKNGKVKILDAQINKEFSGEKAKKLLYNTIDQRIVRLDNLKINKENIKKVESMIHIMTAKEAYNLLNKKFPNLNVFSILDYDDNNYAFSGSDGNYIGPESQNYLVNKRTGAIKYFSPMEDIEKFTDAIDNRSIDIENII